MVITVKFDGKLVLLTAIYLLIGIVALIFAYPGLSIWLPSNSSEMASWVQAVGSILAIAATWYIASLKDIKRQESDNRLAALDASTIHAELVSSRDSLLVLYSRIKEIGRDPGSVYPQNTFSLIAQILSLNLRPLSEQKDLAPVGNNYLSHYAEILRLLSILKSDAKTFSNIISQDRDMALFIFIDEIPGLINEIAKECHSASKVLKSFAAEQGIKLDDQR